MANITTMPTEGPAAEGKGKKGEQAQPPQPFQRAAREYAETFHDESTTIGASAVAVSNVKVPQYGFLRAVILEVVASGGAAGGSNAVAAGNAPWNVLQSVTLRDVGGTPIFGPLDGYDLFLAHKWGGYVWDSDPTNDPAYSAMDTDGDFTFLLAIPVEISQQDGFGSLANMNAAQPFTIDYTVAASSTIYTTAPNTLPSLRVRMHAECWTLPSAVDSMGRPQMQTPPGEGTVQFWSKHVATINSGTNTLQLPRVGNLIRTLALVYYNDASPSVRNDSELPPVLDLYLDGNRLRNERLTRRRSIMRQRYGQDADTGLILWEFTSDQDGHAGSELRERYLPTNQASRLEVRGDFGGAGTLHVITNDVAPATPMVVAG